MEVYAVILAAGRSRRMGAPKAFLGFRGLTFLEQVCRLYTSLRVEAAVVIHPDWLERASQLELGAARIFVNPDTDGGPLSSLRVALRELSSNRLSALIPHPVDHPLVGLDSVARLLNTHRSSPDAIIIPYFEGKPGHPTLFPARFFAELQSIPLDGGARQVVERHPADVCRVDLEDPGVVRNINTPQLYREWVESGA